MVLDNPTLNIEMIIDCPSLLGEMLLLFKFTIIILNDHKTSYQFNYDRKAFLPKKKKKEKKRGRVKVK